MPTMFYVSGLMLQRGATELPRHRTDLAKFFTLADAQAHMERIRATHIADLRIEEREDPEGNGAAHGFKLGELEAFKRLRR